MDAVASLRAVLGPVLGTVAVVALALLTAVPALLLHRDTVGAVLGWAAIVLCLLALRPGVRTRLLYALVLCGVLWYGSQQAADGGFLVTADARGWALIALALVAVLLAVVTLPGPQRRRDDHVSDGGEESADDGPVGAAEKHLGT
ncbi:hypothetical protein [Nocardioides bruguierae]|uniref:Uncharacterized protein n=1 Tax=Nocardioides bruguierae TaxID=2945102 RepID=A0A9X2D7P7_9ACTN|nr:hypothetical protein [Nocardioides bruguierae]MCM0620569.1 hypothetical protein [Nocardioides bruguierae]